MPLITRSALALLLAGCGFAEAQPVVLVHISPENQCSFDERPVDCGAIGAAIVQAHPNTDLEIQVCADHRARSDTVNSTLESLRMAGLRRIGFVACSDGTE